MPTQLLLLLIFSYVHSHSVSKRIASLASGGNAIQIKELAPLAGRYTRSAEIRVSVHKAQPLSPESIEFEGCHRLVSSG
jgi:hypothetical protein